MLVRDRRRHFIIGKENNIEIEIFWNPHIRKWVGLYTIQDLVNKHGNVSSIKLREIPRLLRLRFAELKDPKIKEVRKRMSGPDIDFIDWPVDLIDWPVK